MLFIFFLEVSYCEQFYFDYDIHCTSGTMYEISVSLKINWTWPYVIVLYEPFLIKYLHLKNVSHGDKKIIPAKPLHNHDIVSIYFNHFYYTEFYDKLRRDLAMFTLIYLNVDDCWLTSSMPQQMFKLQILLNYAVIQP